MTLDLGKKADVPEGLAFLELVWGQEDKIEVETDNCFPNLGKKAPACLEQIGTVLSLLDRMASCWWVCRGGDHRIEYLCGRVASNARATLRLLRFGFYDEAIVLCRSIGETANLLQLFVQDGQSFQTWKLSDPKQIRMEFSAVKVRLRLESLSTSPVIDENRYRLLSERGTHVHPETIPQSHNILGIPFAGAKFQENGLLVCLNELALPLAVTTAFGALILDLEKDTKRLVLSASKCLVEHVGAANIVEIDDYNRKVIDSLLT